MGNRFYKDLYKKFKVMKLYLKNNPTIEYIECTPNELLTMFEKDVPAFQSAVDELAETYTTYILLVD